MTDSARSAYRIMHYYSAGFTLGARYGRICRVKLLPSPLHRLSWAVIGGSNRMRISGMKPSVKLGCLFVGLMAVACQADLARDIETVLNDKLLQHASVGIEIGRLGDTDRASHEIYQHNARTPLTPASNLKLATTSAALDRLGASFKFRTVLYVHDGDLVLVGDGDPSFGDG